MSGGRRRFFALLHPSRRLSHLIQSSSALKFLFSFSLLSPLRPLDNYRMQMLSFETRHLPHCYIENEDIHSVEFCGFMTRLELISAINPLWDPRAEFLACAKFYASHLFPSSVLKLRLSLGAAAGVLERLESTEKLCGRTTRRGCACCPGPSRGGGVEKGGGRGVKANFLATLEWTRKSECECKLSLSRAPFALQKCCSVSEMDPSPPSNNNAEGSSAAPGAAGAVPPAGASGAGCPTVHCNVESKLSFKRGCKDDGERSDHYCAWLASQRSKGE